MTNLDVPSPLANLLTRLYLEVVTARARAKDPHRAGDPQGFAQGFAEGCAQALALAELAYAQEVMDVLLRPHVKVVLVEVEGEVH